MARKREVIITNHNWLNHVSPVIDGEQKATGLIPRNYHKYPVGCFAEAPEFSLPLIPEAEWQDRLDSRIKNQQQLSDVRMRGMNGQMIPSRDQNGKGYCWAHSTTSAMLINRAVAGLPYGDLSAYAIACIIKNFQDEGGFGAQSMAFAAQRGIPTAQFWPQRSMDRANDNPQTWADAALHKETKFMDLQPSNKAQLVTCLLLGIPVVSDFSWWGHSVCTVDLVSLDPFRTRIWNSWGDKWSNNGMGILEQEKAIPDAMVAAQITEASGA
jgi:hypothetical protein